MVKQHLVAAFLAAVCVFIVFSQFTFSQWTGTFHIEHEWTKVQINRDGTIDLFYNITLNLDYGDNISYVEVGQPAEGFTIGSAIDQYGHVLNASDVSSGNDFKVRVRLNTPLTAGNSVWFTLNTNVPHMVYEDDRNPGNVGVEFKPAWWPTATVTDLRVAIVLPEGVNATAVKTSVNWDNLLSEPGDRLSVYWGRQNLEPDQRYSFGVSFPKQYVDKYETRSINLPAFLMQYGPLLLIIIVPLVLGSILVVSYRKKGYLTPTISMESLGARRGLTAVEASYLLDMRPPMIVSMILYGLLRKRAVWVESVKPSVKLKILSPFENGRGTAETPLRYYEIDFLKAVRGDGTLDEEGLAQTVMSMRGTVEEKLRGYCRKDTVDYYAKVVDNAWQTVEQAGTPAAASSLYDEKLLWLFLDPTYKTRTETAFKDKAFEPSPLWLWYWYGYQHYTPRPAYQPNIEAPSQSGKPPTMPGADFANNVATAVENTSSNIVVSLERFANAIVPLPPAEAASQPAHQNAECVCACAACACACACVSCACACAGGGVG